MDQSNAQRALAFPAFRPTHQDTPIEGSDEDPLSWPRFSYQESQGPAPNTPSKKRIAVVLASSPRGAGDGYEAGHDKDALDPLDGGCFARKWHIINRSGANAASQKWSWQTQGLEAGNELLAHAREQPESSWVYVKAGRAIKPGDGKRRRGRPAKVSGTPPREVYRKLNPPLISFLCEWAGCKAELHNLDTLRRHVLIVHGRGDAVQCQWGRCGSEEQQSPRRTLEKDMFTAHVEEAHLVPVGWYVGDGPRNSLDTGSKAAQDLPDFLKDAQGNQVTPWVRHQGVEDKVTWKNNRRKLKALLMRRDQNLPDEDSSDGGREEVK